MSSEYNGSRFLTFLLLSYTFNVGTAQLFRLYSFLCTDLTVAVAVSSVTMALFVLFSGFILPPSQIPTGWIWFYWINPVAWVLKAVTINELLSDQYAATICVSSNVSKSAVMGLLYSGSLKEDIPGLITVGTCNEPISQNLGVYILDELGLPTEQIWYVVLYII